MLASLTCLVEDKQLILMYLRFSLCQWSTEKIEYNLAEIKKMRNNNEVSEELFYILLYIGIVC